MPTQKELDLLKEYEATLRRVAALEQQMNKNTSDAEENFSNLAQTLKNVVNDMSKTDTIAKDISKNLAVKNIIKMEAMTSEQASLNAYANTQFYKPKDIYLDQLPIFDSRLIYADKSLATYIQNDKMEIKARKLQEINSRKQKLLIELEMLKNG